LVREINLKYKRKEIEMPRLVGKQSSNSGYVAGALIAIAAIVMAFEYSGLINFVPKFGRENMSLIREQNIR
jgi:hypothetical protein